MPLLFLPLKRGEARLEHEREHPGAGTHQKVAPGCALNRLCEQLPLVAHRLRPHDLCALHGAEPRGPLRAIPVQRHIRHGLDGRFPAVYPHLEHSQQ